MIILDDKSPPDLLRKEFKIVNHGLKEHQAGSIKKTVSQYQTQK